MGSDAEAGGKGRAGPGGLLGEITHALAEGIERVREGSARVARLGRLNLDLLAARGRLRRSLHALGEIAAGRWLDDEAVVLERKEPAIAAIVEEVRMARADIGRIEEACRVERAGGRPPDGSGPGPGGAPG